MTNFGVWMIRLPNRKNFKHILQLHRTCQLTNLKCESYNNFNA